MAQQKYNSMLRYLDVHLQLTPVEMTILAMLQDHTYLADQVVDIPRLQEECQGTGMTATEFSHGFIRLLCNRLLEPQGEFSFTLSSEGYRAKDALVAMNGGLHRAGGAVQDRS